jgi:two-component system response regulator RegA
MTTKKIVAKQHEASGCVARGTLLIVDADEAASKPLACALSARGFEVRTAATVGAGRQAIEAAAPDYALVELRLGKESGLDIVIALSAARPNTRIVIFSGHGGTAHTVAGIKAGATDHLPKPASIDAIEAALLSDIEPSPRPIEVQMMPERVRWEHVQTIFRQSGRNVSETARTLRMHRRTLQRLLAKGEPRL